MLRVYCSGPMVSATGCISPGGGGWASSSPLGLWHFADSQKCFQGETPVCTDENNSTTHFRGAKQEFQSCGTPALNKWDQAAVSVLILFFSVWRCLYFISFSLFPGLSYCQGADVSWLLLYCGPGSVLKGQEHNKNRYERRAR